jgi:uncharacterized PurR-regulated membrane protein YhhQ (DUF165 family)
VLISSYLLAIVVANLSVTHFGEWALPFTAFLLIPFDLVARDVLHERWLVKNKFNMYASLFGLVLCGGIISFIINRESQQIAIASSITFLAVGAINTTFYQLLIKVKRIHRMNISNTVSSFADSLLFPLIAFNIIDLNLFLSQSSSKIIGGVFWAWIFVGRKNASK